MNGLLETTPSFLEGSWFIAYISVFFAGVLTSFTPCVYPMIPITIGIVGGQEKSGHLHSFILSLFYVIGLALTYGGLGVIASLTGNFFGSVSSNPITLLIVANIIILFGLSMLDVFMIPIPQFFSKTHAGTNKHGVPGAFFMGLASGLIAAPCTTPVLGVLITFVATKQNVLFGATLLITFAFGMSMLLLVIGTFTGIVTAIPKSGMWMVRVKKIMGYLLIIMGEYFLIQAGKVW
ncbi:MAG: sulfite exporter TauE/SafE family protein [Candidatus Latescibacteria bacterium]|nr:sulfite exporter TauE/SafE family protein [Candidatus Latescibacterota bacterium]